jgi:hypothetical protein
VYTQPAAFGSTPRNWRVNETVSAGRAVLSRRKISGIIENQPLVKGKK